MQQSPPLPAIIEWLKEHNPLGRFGERFDMHDIDPKPWSGHFNYLITLPTERFVLRFKGPEWGEPTQGIIDEYRILKALEPHNVAPKAFYLAEDFFGEGMLLEEYMDGTILNELLRAGWREAMRDVAGYIAKLNTVPVTTSEIPHRELLTSYAFHKREWRERVDLALQHPPTRALAERIEALLPLAESMLDRFEERLDRALSKIPPSFVFISSHVGHCLKRKDDFRFFNWEQVSFGDPSYTLAVFLASIKNDSEFGAVKQEMIATYLEHNPVPEFAELVDQRLAEREVANLTWSLWSHAYQKSEKPAEETGIMRRFEAVQRLLQTK
jgi:hypothetical protein